MALPALMIWLPTNICSLVAPTVQLFLEQNEEEAEKMAEKEEKAREIEKSTIKVGGRRVQRRGCLQQAVVNATVDLACVSAAHMNGNMSCRHVSTTSHGDAATLGCLWF